MIVVEDVRTNSNRVEGSIRTGSQKKTVYFESSTPLVCAPEAFVLLALPVAMRCGEPLHSEVPLNPGFLATLPAVQSIYERWNQKLSRIKIHAAASATAKATHPGSALFFTGGVDSFYSANCLADTTLVFVHGFDIKLQNTKFRREVANRLHEAAGALQQPLIEIETNLRELTDPYLAWLYSFGGALAACGWMLSGRFDHFNISSAFDVRQFNENQTDLYDGSQPNLSEAFCTPDLRFLSVGDTDRIGKLRAIADLPAVKEHLRVCWENRGGAYNCGACDKCLRTMAALAALKKLEQFQCFERELSYKRLARAVPPLPIMNHFVHESIACAKENNADPRLLASLEKSLSSPLSWFWRLHSRHTPLQIKDWAFRLESKLEAARHGGESA